MSKIKVNRLENTSTANGGIDIDTSGHVQVDGLQLPTAGPLSNRNMIINGAMQVAQRGTTGISQNNNNNYVVDRFKGSIAGGATITHSQETTGAPDGFQNWLKVVVTTADTSIASTDHGTMLHPIEGYNFAQTRYGFSDAKAVTVSFKFKTNKAGTYCMIHRNGAADRNFLYEFTPVADGNWQTITYTVPGDTTGTWQKTSALGWRWELCLANGTSYQSSTVGSWFSGSYFHSTPNQVNFLDSTSNELGITGVQVEVGSKATPFEHESYSQTLAKCQRYYYRINPSNGAMFGPGIQYNATSAIMIIDLPVNMRSNISAVEQSGTAGHYGIIYGTNTATCNAVPSFGGDPNNQNITVNFNVASGAAGATGDGVIGRSRNNAAYLGFSAEL